MAVILSPRWLVKRNNMSMFKKGKKEDPTDQSASTQCLGRSWNRSSWKKCGWQGDDRDSQHGFTRGKSCLVNLVVLYNGVAALVDSRRAMNAIYFDFSKTFDMVLYSILVAKLERYVFDGWTVWWIRNWLDDDVQRITINVQVQVRNKWCPLGIDVVTDTVQYIY